MNITVNGKPFYLEADSGSFGIDVDVAAVCDWRAVVRDERAAEFFVLLDELLFAKAGFSASFCRLKSRMIRAMYARVS